MKRIARGFLGSLLMAAVIAGISLASSSAQNDASGSGLSIQVTPSPLVATVKPGMATELELRIRNTNTARESLVMGLRSFGLNDETGEVILGEAVDDDIKDIVTFSDPEFDLEAGEWFTQRLAINVPETAGFSYSFATTISRAASPNATQGAAIEGTVAVFTLINVDRPDAKRSFEMTEVSTEKNVYDYLPATIKITLKNTGNTIIQPKGTVYIERSGGSDTPIATLQLNESDGYLLPDSSRSFNTSWTDGFPYYETKNTDDGPVRELKWDFKNASKLRIGKYTAKVVAVYDDGERDVPVLGEVTFWVIPWKQIVLLALCVVLLLIGIIVTARTLLRSIRKTTQKTLAPPDEKS